MTNESLEKASGAPHEHLAALAKNIQPLGVEIPVIKSADQKLDVTEVKANSRLHCWIRRAEAAFLLVGSFLLAAWVVRERVFVTAELGHIGLWAYPVAILLLAVVASAPFSVTDALAVMNGVIFGPVRGSLVNAAGIVCAAIVGYYVARRTSSLLELDKTIERLPSWVRHFRIGSFAFLVTVRILPGIGGTVATQVAAAKRVPLFVHVLAMCAIAVPICTALAIGGDTLSRAIGMHVTEPLHRYEQEHHMSFGHFLHLHHRHETEFHTP